MDDRTHHSASTAPHATAASRPCPRQRRSSRERDRPERAARDPPRRRADGDSSASPPTPSCASRPTAAAASWCGSIRRSMPTAAPASCGSTASCGRRSRRISTSPSTSRQAERRPGASASSSIPPSTSRWRMTSCRTSRRCCARRARRSAIGAVLYVPFPKSHAGTTYEVQHVTRRPRHCRRDRPRSSCNITTRICRTARSTSPSRTSAA